MIPGGDLQIKKPGVPVGNFFSPKGTKILFCGRGLKYFSPAVELLRPNNLTGTKSHFVAPKGNYKHPIIFMWEFPPGMIRAFL